MQHPCPSPYAEQHKAVIPDNPGKPARKLGGSLELIQVLICSHIRILNFFFRLCAVTQNINCQSKTSRMMPPNEFSKSVAIVPSCCRHQVHIGQEGSIDRTFAETSHLLFHASRIVTCGVRRSTRQS